MIDQSINPGVIWAAETAGNFPLDHCSDVQSAVSCTFGVHADASRLPLHVVYFA